MGFLYFILALLLISLFFRLFFKYILPFILLRYIKKKQNQQDQYNNAQKEGEIKIENKSDKKAHLDPEVGEYVDFEDVDDDK